MVPIRELLLPEIEHVFAGVPLLGGGRDAAIGAPEHGDGVLGLGSGITSRAAELARLVEGGSGRGFFLPVVPGPAHPLARFGDVAQPIGVLGGEVERDAVLEADALIGRNARILSQWPSVSATM